MSAERGCAADTDPMPQLSRIVNTVLTTSLVNSRDLALIVVSGDLTVQMLRCGGDRARLRAPSMPATGRGQQPGRFNLMGSQTSKVNPAANRCGSPLCPATHESCSSAPQIRADVNQDSPAANVN